MTKKFPTAIRWFRSDNRKSKIQKGPENWRGLSPSHSRYVGLWPRRSSRGKYPRMGYLSASALVVAHRPTPKHCGKVLGIWAMLRDRTSPSNTDGRREMLNGFPPSRRSWFGSRLISSSPREAPAGRAAKKATSAIPIIFVGAVDPVASGLVASLARPGGNITGFSTGAPGLYGKRLEILKETLPRLSRVGVLLNPANPSADVVVKRDPFRRTRAGRAGSIPRGAKSQRYR